MKFIKLTEARGHTIRVNMEMVQLYERPDGEPETCMDLCGEDYILVRETPEDIDTLLTLGDVE